MWLVFPEVFRNDFCSGLDHRRVAETLLEHGMLKCSENRTDGRLDKQQRVKMPGDERSKPQWFYWITDKILDSSEDEA